MIALTVLLDATRALQGKKVQEADGQLIIAALDGGMGSGNPSVGLAIEMSDGSFLVAQTSLKLFLTAADAFRARFGDPRVVPTGSAA